MNVPGGTMPSFSVRKECIHTLEQWFCSNAYARGNLCYSANWDMTEWQSYVIQSHFQTIHLTFSRQNGPDLLWVYLDNINLLKKKLSYIVIINVQIFKLNNDGIICFKYDRILLSKYYLKKELYPIPYFFFYLSPLEPF